MMVVGKKEPGPGDLRAGLPLPKSGGFPPGGGAANQPPQLAPA